jgi:hypothetical protein
VGLVCLVCFCLRGDFKVSPFVFKYKHTIFVLMRETFKTQYNYLIQSVSGYKFYELKETKKNKVQIDTFLNYISEYDLWDFLCYQFFRYHNKKTRFGKGIIQLSWIIGQKAIEEWEEKTPERWFRCVEWKIETDISNPLYDHRYTPSSSFLDKLRLKHYEKELGFLMCMDADLFDENSSVCKICKFRDYCEKQKLNKDE